MNQLPLNAVENTLEDTMIWNSNKDESSKLGKSPRKLTMTEKRVINGLKQLTEMIFKPHYRQAYGEASVLNNENSINNIDENTVIIKNVPMEMEQSEAVKTTTTQQQPTHSLSPNDDTTISDANKTNRENFERFMDVAMKEAEQFCAMVVQQLADDNRKELNDDWHRGQLDAYNAAHKRLIEQSTAIDNLDGDGGDVSSFFGGKSEQTVVRQLAEF